MNAKLTSNLGRRRVVLILITDVCSNNDRHHYQLIIDLIIY